MNCDYPRPFQYTCPLPNGLRCRRRRRQSNMVSCLSTMMFLASVGMTSPFYGRQQKDNDDDHTHTPTRGAFFRSSLQSFAEQGASKWGDYVSTATKSKAMTRSSTVYISQLHQTIQRMRSNSAGDSSSTNSHLKEEMEHNDEDGTAPSEHFMEEILAAMLGGATAGSAFAAATAGAFAATAIMALGAIATVFFTDEKDEILSPDNVLPLFDNVNIGERVIVEDAGCDYNGEGRDDHDMENDILPAAIIESPSHKLPGFILEELIKCYKGNPEVAVSIFPSHDASHICIADGSEIIGTHDNIMGAENELLLVEPSKIVSEDEHICGSADGCKQHLLPPMEHAVPKRVEVVWHDTHFGGSNAQYYTDSPSHVRHPRRSPKHRAPRNPIISSDTSRISLTDAERDGALLLAETFRVASSAFGLLASGVRFAGETAAATAGGTARLAGGAVRLSGWAVGSLGEAIENGGSGRENNSEQDRISSSVRPDLNTKSKRKVAGTSVRLIGDAIEQIADSLLLAGSATEHVAFAATGAAEGTLRIMESSLTRISDVFSKEGRRGSNKLSSAVEMESSIDIDELASDSEDVSPFEVTTFTPEADISSQDLANETFSIEVQNLVHSFSSLVAQNVDQIVADTAGVHSIAMEMLGVLILCFTLSVFLLRSKNPSKKEELGQLHRQSRPSKQIKANVSGGEQYTISFGNRCKTETNHQLADDDSHTTLTAESTMRGHDLDSGHAEPTTAGATAIFYVLLIPLKLVRSIVTIIWSAFFRKEAALLVFYLLGWVFLSRSAQYKASVIQRKSELTGFQLAIMSIDKDSPSIESAAWLNALIQHAWRVKSGGFEPMLSSYLSSMLAESLSQPYSKSSGVAHVALDAFTLGSSPPMISRIELNGLGKEDDSIILMNIDVGMLLRDAVLLLDIKPSSLEYRSLPSTKMSVNSLDAKGTFNLSVKCTPEYPYISFLNISLVEIPDFNLKIEPQRESGLKGVDFGSIPILSSWIKSSIGSSLAYYLSPQHISIDILAWLKDEDIVVTYYER